MPSRNLPESWIRPFRSCSIRWESPYFKGYLYLRDCIKLVAKDFDRLGSIMKTVYPVVAEKY